MRYYYIIIFLFVSAGFGFGQQKKGRCGTDKVMEKYEALHPVYRQSLERGFEEFKKSTRLIDTNTLFIPVHVIVVHNPSDPVGQGTNHSLAKIQSQINVINQDYTRTNSDADETPDVFSQGNPNIIFCLANIDPDGNVTDGVTRYPSTLNFDDAEIEIKTATAWPREQYLNIWVADIEDLGFAYLPTTTSLPNANVDGVVINHSAFGGPGTGAASPYNLGRTATHEIGHFLGLRHVWRNDGCNQDDGMDDTPIQDDENFGCPTHPSISCGNSGDMFMNYMDYTDDNCMNAFTEQQSAYMREILIGVRASLLSSGVSICGNLPLEATLDAKKDITCFGLANGEIKVKAGGGKPPYTYSLGTQSNTTGLFTNLEKGSYSIFVEDSDGSLDTVEVEIVEPAAIVINETVTNNVCFGEKKGSIRMSATGGVTVVGFRYSKDGVTYSLNPNINQLFSGEYTVYAKDANECIATKTVTVGSPPELKLQATILDVLCFGDSTGSIFLLPEGGVEPYTYTVNGEAAPLALLANLPVGNYNMVVTDANKCKLDSVFSVNEPPALVTIFNVTDILCFGDSSGTISLFSSGGSLPYQSKVNNGEFSDKTLYESLSKGPYDLEVVDANGCRNLASLEIKQPEALEIQSVFATPDANGTYTVTIDATEGGVLPYQYFIDSEENIQSDSMFTGIELGEHEVWVVDGNGCRNRYLFVITNIKEDFSIEEFSLYPNPVIDNLAIKYFGNKEQEVKLEIFDISGKLISGPDKIKFSPEKNIHNIFVNTIANSILLIKIASKFKSSHFVIFKE